MVLKDIRENLSMETGPAYATSSSRGGLHLSLKSMFILVIVFVLTLIGLACVTYSFTTCPRLPIAPAISANNKARNRPSVTSKESVEAITIERNSDINEIIDSNEETIAAPVASLPDGSVRLPRSIIPLKYNISLVPFLVEGNFTFHGEVSIRIAIEENCSNVTLHANDLRISEGDVTVRQWSSNATDDPTTAISITKQYFIESKQFFVIELAEELQKDLQYEISIKFRGYILDYLEGFYRSSYEVGTNKRWLASTQFQATDARRAFPCFDEPAMKANFTLNIARPKNMSSISNMPKVKGALQPVDGVPNYVWDHFKESLPMSTYLVAFVVSDFASLRNGSFSVWARADAIQSAQYALSVGPKVLKFYEEFFNIKFPLPKMDMVALPDFQAGAMENWGLITYRETAMLFEEGVTASTHKQRIASVVAHELAHQWFGNLVTPSWWSDIWLNEGFASYMDYVALEAVEPQWKSMDLFVVYELQSVFLFDALSSSHQISVEVGNPDEISELFDRISYSKGATIIRMMSNFLTSKVFRMGLTKYLKEMAYKSAEQDDLWRFLTEEAMQQGLMDKSMCVKQIMDTWTLQMGFPVVTVSRDPTSNDVIRLEQQRFVYVNETSNPSPDLLWWIPISYTTSTELNFDNTRPSHWMPPAKIYDIESKNLSSAEWFIFNTQQTGYYRVNYDLKNWNAVTAHLLDKKRFKDICSANRAQLIDDALNLARGGYLDYGTALNLTTYLKHEDEYVPWKAAITALNFINAMVVREGDYHLFKHYLVKLMDNVYKNVGFDEKKDQQDMLNLSKRIEILSMACHLGHSECIREFSKQFQNWMFDPRPDSSNPTTPNLRHIVYCTAIQHGTEEEWDFAYERYLKSSVSYEKATLLTALGCSKEPWILSRYLKRALSGKFIRKQDAYRVFAAVSSNVVGQQIAFDFVRTNWNEMKTYLGSSTSNLNTILELVTRRMNTQFQLNEFEDFLIQESIERSRTVQQQIEQIEINIDWMQRNYNPIIDWLRKQSEDYVE